MRPISACSSIRENVPGEIQEGVFTDPAWLVEPHRAGGRAGAVHPAQGRRHGRPQEDFAAGWLTADGEYIGRPVALDPAAGWFACSSPTIWPERSTASPTENDLPVRTAKQLWPPNWGFSMLRRVIGGSVLVAAALAANCAVAADAAAGKKCRRPLRAICHGLTGSPRTPRRPTSPAITRINPSSRPTRSRAASARTATRCPSYRAKPSPTRPSPRRRWIISRA